MVSKTAFYWIAIGAAIIGGIIYYVYDDHLKSLAASEQSARDRAVTELPPGVEAAWIDYVDKRMDALIRVKSGGIAVQTLTDQIMGNTTQISRNMPFKVSCAQVGGGTIEFGSGDNNVLVWVYGGVTGRRIEPEPVLGVSKFSMAARRLNDTLCDRISNKLNAMMAQ